MCTIAIEAIIPLDRTLHIKMDKNIARSILFCRIAKRPIRALESYLKEIWMRNYRIEIEWINQQKDFLNLKTKRNISFFQDHVLEGEDLSEIQVNICYFCGLDSMRLEAISEKGKLN